MSDTSKRIWAWETLDNNGQWSLEEGGGVEYVIKEDYDALAAKLDEADERIAWLDCGFEQAMADTRAAEARIAHLENHIEGVAKDTHKIMVDLANPLHDPRVLALPKPSVAEWPYWTVCPKVLEEIRQDAGEWAGEAYLQTVEAIALAVVRRIDAISALEENK